MGEGKYKPAYCFNHLINNEKFCVDKILYLALYLQVMERTYQNVFGKCFIALPMILCRNI